MELSAVRSPLSLPANRDGYCKPAAPVIYRQPCPVYKTNRTTGAAFVSKRNGSISEIRTQSTNREFLERPGDRKFRGWIHFVGVGGCGLSALAMLALKQGFEVTGSDITWSSYMDPLHEAGASLHIGHSKFNLLKNDGSNLPDAIVVSSAIPADNVEILHAKASGVPVYKRGAWLGKITEDYNLIAVSGSHGKSTTASMLAYLMHAMGDDITAVVGAKVPEFDGANIICGTSNNFVLEADEYDHCFLGLRPHIAVVTNVDWEHVDIFRDEEEVKATFRRFIRRIRDGGHLILCGDSSAGASSLFSNGKTDTGLNISNDFETFPSSELCHHRYHITTYGVSSFNEWHASSVHPNSYGGSDYKLYHKGNYVAEISLQMPGIHNVTNSLAVIATMNVMASDEKGIFDTIPSLGSHLHNFSGICRRFEMVGEICGCHIYDDYAHHPTEIRAVLQAARQRFPLKELFVIFQPHTYSRLAALKSEFAAAFKDADQVVVTEVYAARETSHSISGRDLARSIVCLSSEFIPSLDSVLDKLVSLICKDPYREIVILTLGPGDITTLGRKLLCELQLRL